MRLKDLLQYDNIIIQCHDNPDADAIASGYGVFCYLHSQGKQVRLIYGGKFMIQKSNLVLMITELKIPIEHVTELAPPQLLVTVDCQYGEGNVTKFDSKKVAVIDHHQVSGTLPELNEVRSNLGSCSTIVWELLRQEGIDINSDKRLSTALYYGLLTDTNNFAELSHPLDKDLRDDAAYDRSLIVRLRNTNLSLKELEIAGMALVGYSYNETYRYALVEAEPCDPNILGMISDLVLEVDAVDTCLVYSILPFGIKISVRSCIKEVKASELAEFITDAVGSGGGHLEKAGGFIQTELLSKICGNTKDETGAFFRQRLNSYFEDTEIIFAKDYLADVSSMQQYEKMSVPVGFVEAAKMFPIGTTVCVRTMEGDLDVEIRDDIFLMIGVKGEVYPCRKEKFERSYRRLDAPYNFYGEYEPTIKDIAEGKNVSLIPYAMACVATGQIYIYAKELNHRTKVFTSWDEEKYMLGKAGDYLAVRKDDLHDIYIIEHNIFGKTYKKVDSK